jgi:hypothetical protein
MGQLFVGLILIGGLCLFCGIRLMSICLYPSRYQQIED